MRKLIAAVLVAPLLGNGNALAQSGSLDPATRGPYPVDVEALAWWFKSSPTPTPIITDGLYPRPGTHVLLGGGDMDNNPNPGLRLTAGYVVNERWALEGNFLYFDSRSTGSGVSSTGNPGSTNLLLPYFDVTLNRESITEISLAPVYAGSATVELKNSLMGAEANALYALDSAQPWTVGLVGGFRWLQLKETYTITTSSPFIPPGPEGDIWQTTDKFAARNDFYGAELGARARYTADRWSRAASSSRAWVRWCNRSMSMDHCSPTTSTISGMLKRSRAVTSRCRPTWAGTAARYSRSYPS